MRDNPKSSESNSWLELAKDHPEFFRFSELEGGEKSAGLLIRFLKNGKDEKNNDLRDPLTVNEAQKLVDQAI